MINIKYRIFAITTVVGLLFGSLANPALANFEVHGQSVADNERVRVEANNWADVDLDDFFGQIFGRHLKASMQGEEEVPGPGDVDGVGEAKIRLKPNKNQICAKLEVKYIDQATAAHIHHAPKGSAGVVIVALPIPNEDGKSEGCIEVDSELLEKIRSNPQDYYVNVHNNAYPNGAIRGQLSR